MYVYDISIPPSTDLAPGRVHMVYPTLQDLWAYWEFVTFPDWRVSCFKLTGPSVREALYTNTFVDGTVQEIWEGGTYEKITVYGTALTPLDDRNRVPSHRVLSVRGEHLIKLSEHGPIQHGPILERTVFEYLVGDV